MSRLRYLLFFALLVAFGSLSTLRAQVSLATPRVVGPVDESSLTTMKGSLTALARPEFDRGAASPSTQYHNVRLVIQRSPEQEAALKTFMAEQLDRGSPYFHRWLTPDGFDRLYGLADSDKAAIVAWLESHGLTVGRVSATDIAFSGTVAQIEQTLHTSIHSFVTPSGRHFFSNISEPSIPAAFSNVIGGVAFLDTLQPVAHNVPGPSGKYDAIEHKFVNASASPIHAHPDLTTGSSPDQSLWVVPADAATIYDTPNMYNAAFSSGTSYTGSGVTIGIGGDGAIQASTVVDYRTRFLNGDTTAPVIKDVDAASGHPAQANGDTDEAYLDTEIAGGLAPGATIDFYVADRATTNGLFDVIPQMLKDNSVAIFSLSFGECELFLPTADNQQLNTWWQQAAAQGITVTVSTGDSGSAGCDNQDTALIASLGLAVSGFSTTPYNIAVGGTDFYGLLNGDFSTYVNSNATSSNFWRSAKTYIPESAWNDSTTNNGQISANVPYVNPSTSDTNIIGGTGGKSTCSTNTTTYSGSTMTTGTCTSGYTKPPWQTGTGVPNDSARDVPDVALFAGNGFYGAAWLVCTDDTTTNSSNQTVTENCTKQSDNNFYWAGIGGTSASTPAFAGILALVVQKNGGRIGLDGAKFLYDLNNGSGSASFHDITQGNNSVICTSGTPNCQAMGSFAFLSGYNTNVGYDLATGLGSVDATKLVADYGSSSPTGTATVTVAANPSSITTAQQVQVTVTVAGSGSLGTPTGTVTLSGGGYTSSATTLDNTGAASFTIPAGALAAGTDTLTASYSGDSNYAAATGTTQVTVSNAAKLTPTVTVTPASTSITTSQSLNVSVSVSGTGATPTGSITLTSGTYSSTATNLNGGGATITIPAGMLAAAADTLTASYSGDSNYAAATGTAQVTVTVAAPKITPTVTVTPASSSIDTGQSLNVSVAVSGGSGNPIPTGNVTLIAGSYSSSATPLDNTGSATFTIPTNAFTSSGNIGVTYAGDSNYTSATGSATVTLTQSAFSLPQPTNPAAITPGGTASETITVNSSNNYSGTISFTCSLTGPPPGAADLPTCSPGNPVTLSSSSTSGTTTFTVTTTAATSGSLDRRGLPGWLGAGGGTALALLVFFGIPARRRSWRNLLGLLVTMAVLGTLSACGGGGNGGGGGGGGGNSGTTAGNYTFTVTGTGNPSTGSSITTTFTVTVN